MEDSGIVPRTPQWSEVTGVGTGSQRQKLDNRDGANEARWQKSGNEDCADEARIPPMAPLQAAVGAARGGEEGVCRPEVGSGGDPLRCHRARRHGSRGGQGGAGRGPRGGIESNGRGLNGIDPNGGAGTCSSGSGFPERRGNLGGEFYDTTDGTAGGYRTNYPINGAGNGPGTDGVRSEGAGDPPTNRRDGTKTPRGS